MKLLHLSHYGLGHAADPIGAAWFEPAGGRSGWAQQCARAGDAGAIRRVRSLAASEPEGRPPRSEPIVGLQVVGGSVADEAASVAGARPVTD